MVRRNILLICATLLALIAIGCGTKPISEVLAHPERFRDEDIAIQGRVVSSFSIKGIGAAFQLDDGTGRIWVFTRNRPAPPEHIHIYVGGRVRTAVTLGDRTLGIALEEKGRRRGD
jgi:hypothetical protein